MGFKGEKTKNVWFYKIENDGYSLDDKRLKIDENDISDVLLKFKNRALSKKSWIVTFDEIKDNDWNLSASKYQPFTPEKIEFENPIDIINEISKIELEINDDLNKLKKMINNV